MGENIVLDRVTSKNKSECCDFVACNNCAKNEILNSTTTFGGGIYSRTVKVYSFI